MPYSITSSIKTLIASFLFILVSILYEFNMVPSVYILLSPQEGEVHSPYWRHRCTHSAAHSSKVFKPLSVITWLCQVIIVDMEKTQTKNSTVLWFL